MGPRQSAPVRDRFSAADRRALLRDAGQASIRAALSWALGGAEPYAGRELAARLVRWWIANGRYSEAGQFLATVAGAAAAAPPGIQARALLGAAWSALHLGDTRRAAPLAADGDACARRAGEPRLEVWGRLMLAGLAWQEGDADRIVAEIDASRVLSGQADPALATRAQGLLANAAFLSGDLAEHDRHGRLAIELARTAAGQEGLALALTNWSMAAIAGTGIQPATVAALDEAANLTAAHPDSFTETAMRHCRAELFAILGQLEAAETEAGLCWAAGRGGAVRLVEVAAALRYAEGVMAWHRGELAGAEHLVREATVQWHRCGDQMGACDGVELLGVLAAARERYTDAARLLPGADAARRPLRYLAPGFTASRGAAARAASQARTVPGDDRFTQAWDQGQGLPLDDAVAYATRKGGGRKRPATG